MSRTATTTTTHVNHHPSLLLLERCISANTLKQVHAHLITTGLALHTFPLSRLLSSSLLLGPSYAAAVFRHFPRQPTTFLYNTLISSLAAHHHPSFAWSFYSTLVYEETHIRPNSYTYPSLLKALGSSAWSFHGRSLHSHIFKFLGNAHDCFVQAALLSLYSRCGNIGACRHLFDEIPHPDLATWNSILAAYARATAAYADDWTSSTSGYGMEALFLFQEMQLLGVTPDEITLVAVIGACGDLGALGQGAWAHAYAIRSDHLVLNHFVGTALIEMYGKCGQLKLARQLFDALPRKDTPCYNAIIHGLAIHGYGRGAIELFGRMKMEGVKVNDVTMVAVMSACAHSGLVEEGRQCFDEMSILFRIEPKVEHYGCLVDLFGRAGHVEEAEEVVRIMPVKPSATIYRSLLGACRVHGKVGIGENAIRCLMKLDPYHGGNYVLLSNLYANNDRWDDVKRVRREMKDMGINKTPGISFIEMDGIMHEFSTGDRVHQHVEDIFAVVEEMGQRLHECGLVSAEEEAFFNIEENG